MRRTVVLVLLCCLQTATGEVPVRVGADRLLDSEYFDYLRGKRIGVITNSTGVNSELQSTLDILARHPQVEVAAIFSPEHGLLGQAQAGEAISSYGNVHSLYGDTHTPTTQMLAQIDLLLYDIQDVGVRFYTYISTLYLSMQAAAKSGIPLIVLDRPDPLGGSTVEGPVLEQGHESFVGIDTIPVRYGMTPGELARFLNGENNIDCNLTVFSLSGWRRSQWYDQTGLEWIPPSPNMPYPSTAVAYAGFCLIEGSNLSEGRGTTRPFEFIGAPWLNSRELAGRLNQLRLAGSHFRPQAFTPSFSKYQGRLCRGVHIHVPNRDSFRPVTVALHFLAEVRKLHPDKFKFYPESFDSLAGNSWIREALLDNQPVERIVERWHAPLRDFRNKRQKYLLYP